MRVLIVGGGIGGLATALKLHQAGLEVEIFERSPEIRELGVGINTLPHAIKELADLGLLDALDKVAIRTHELIYMNRFGQEIWREKRGLDAGLDYPQFSIHRGKLQKVLLDVVLDRIGADHVHTGHELTGFSQTAEQVTGTFATASGTSTEVSGDVLIGADGIHSAVRRTYYPDEGPPSWNGIILWRGALETDPFLTGRSMIIAGGLAAKLVLYPISNDVSDSGKTLLNWAVASKIGDSTSPPPRREDWSRAGRLDELMAKVEGVFHLDLLDVPALIRATPEFYEYPMCDRDPLPRWSHGRVTLLGDAAHPMYPVGSNGASQAILDACALADLLTSGHSVEAALTAYDDARRPMTAEIVRKNRLGGPEGVIDLVEQRAPDGFNNLSDVVTEDEIKALVSGYAQLAGFSKEAVNRG
ncbi:MAG: flavin-dependent oxidoreductase [Pseudomonadota bacterium]